MILEFTLSFHWLPDRPRPGPPTYDLDPAAADRRAAAETRRVDFL